VPGAARAWPQPHHRPPDPARARTRLTSAPL
jgi:hypothetical protein